MIPKLLLGLSLSISLTTLAATPPGGITFSCLPSQQVAFESELQQYLESLGIKKSWIDSHSSPGGVTYQLSGELAKTSPVHFFEHPELDLRNSIIHLPTVKPGKTRAVLSVSQKEIALALLHPGRATEAPCDIQELKDHIGIRQNTVAWAECLEWGWPDGGPARWNKKYWNKGTPTKDVVAAVNDTFVQQKKYAIGCYTASKLVVAQGVLDYYARIRPDSEKLNKIVERLFRDKDPLINIEPPGMWFFETDFNKADLEISGKLMKLTHNVAPENFIPGDWAYLRNTDDATNEKTGYEGSNAIYLGRGKFDDFYNDHYYSYTYLEKLDEVYQWRNEVFSRSRDMGKVHPLNVVEVYKLGLAPEQNGLVMPYRAVPYFFGDALPH